MVNIKSKRLLLRNLRKADLADFLAYRQDPEVCKYQGFDTFSEQQAIDFIEQQKAIRLGEVGHWVQIGIELQATQQLIGDCAIQFLAEEPRMIELGNTINPEFQKQGFATETMSCLLNHVFQFHAVHKAIALIDVRNISSIQLIKKLGFEQEGYFRKNFYDAEIKEWIDEYRYSLLKEDFKEVNLG